MVARPTPHIASTGSGCRKPTTCSGVTSISPSGWPAARRPGDEFDGRCPPNSDLLLVATDSSSEQTALNSLADAGGRPHAGLLTHFYLGNSTTELTELKTSTMALETSL